MILNENGSERHTWGPLNGHGSCGHKRKLVVVFSFITDFLGWSLEIKI